MKAVVTSMAILYSGQLFAADDLKSNAELQAEIVRLNQVTDVTQPAVSGVRHRPAEWL
jgi:hypothetical protein